MKIYAVGGIVRNKLLGLPAKDKDYLVVGSTPSKMSSLGFYPIGKDFPVFLHPKTHNTYALARTEKKVSFGYNGFNFFYSPKITLKEDLIRRDLTINSMAYEVTTFGKSIGPIIDIFNGKNDLKNKIFRHVSYAFIEDPIRILRIARFSAYFINFKIAKETMILINKMRKNGLLNELVPERIWKEISQGLMEKKPSRMFYILNKCKVLSIILPEINIIFKIKNNNKNIFNILDYLSKKKYSLDIRFSILMQKLNEIMYVYYKLPYKFHIEYMKQTIKIICKKLHIQNNCKKLSLLVINVYFFFKNILKIKSINIIKLFFNCDAIRRPNRFNSILKIYELFLTYKKDKKKKKKIKKQLQKIKKSLILIKKIDINSILSKNKIKNNLKIFKKKIHKKYISIINNIFK